MTDPTRRFSSRVENYIKYRPSYPTAVVQVLEQECGLAPSSPVADIGSGTGILTELFLQHGNPVFAVEPNREMREAGERLLRTYEKFASIDGSAEATTLANSSVDFATAGQAFHWFDREQTRAELARILRPQGWAVLVWNQRRVAGTPFLAAYERLLRAYGIDYQAVRQTNVDEKALSAFFGPAGYRQRVLENSQSFDFAGLKGRLLSSSYTPEPGHPSYQPMLAELQRIFDSYNADGRVSILYDTSIYYGRLS